MEDLKCQYEERCKETYTDEKTNKFRENCDCISCTLCDLFWSFYDHDYLEKQSKK